MDHRRSGWRVQQHNFVVEDTGARQMRVENSHAENYWKTIARMNDREQTWWARRRAGLVQARPYPFLRL